VRRMDTDLPIFSGTRKNLKTGIRWSAIATPDPVGLSGMVGWSMVWPGAGRFRDAADGRAAGAPTSGAQRTSPTPVPSCKGEGTFIPPTPLPLSSAM
jgi:hypothetical protein